ncbi:MAG: hypothetical protein GHCLOJNM_04465 [bacterium]|nr:hypothetical protein [bacterium]
MRLLAGISWFILFASQSVAVTAPTEAEMTRAKGWIETHLSGSPETLPFSFIYNGIPFAEQVKSWRFEKTSKEIDSNRKRHTLLFTDPKTGLLARCEAVEYLDFPAVEWTLHFKNQGASETPILEKIEALDLHLQSEGSSDFLLHHSLGSQAKITDYAPQETALGPGASKRLSGAGGRPTNADMSYFNLEWDGGGLIVSVGWPGQWASDMVREGPHGLHLSAGQELTHFKLVPGEEVRSPLIVLQFWKGDWLRSQNQWRRWMMAHGMPRPGGKLPSSLMLASSSRAYEEMIKADTEKQKFFIDRYLEERLPLDYWWMDAGWYIQEKGWPQVGTWEVDLKRFPKGLREVSDYAHSKGFKVLVWFEPERVAPGTWLAENHPEWILGGKEGGLLNLGNPEAWNWLVGHVDTILVDQGIDLYRQDFNMDPLEHWRKNDPEDRQGITEIKHVMGYLAYWDELLRRHPGMLIDACASGGRRNDLETMRRAVPLWKSDYAYEPIGTQGMNYGIPLWIPYFGTGTVCYAGAPYYGTGLHPIEPYAFWSNAAPAIACGFDMREKDLDYEAIRHLFAQWREITPLYLKDYYPLTGYSQEKNVWIAWQFHDPEKQEGLVQAFRRPECREGAIRLKLHDLEVGAKYRVASIEGPDQATEMTGKNLVEEGLEVRLDSPASAAVIRYHRAR